MMSTVVAAMGRKVVSVDPMVQHLSYLRRSLELLGNQDNVRLLNNAVRYKFVGCSYFLKSFYAVMRLESFTLTQRNPSTKQL